MKKKTMYLLYILVEIVLLYCAMDYFGYGDLTFRWKVLLWAVLTSLVTTFIFYKFKVMVPGSDKMNHQG